MISEELRRYVERTFPHPLGEDGAERAFHAAIFATLESCGSLVRLGERLDCPPEELMALKRIQEAHRSGVIPGAI